jgi:hypothetical protein
MVVASATLQPDDRIRDEVRGEGFAKPGETVHLFYGMSKQAKEEFCQNALVPVFRMGKGYYFK